MGRKRHSATKAEGLKRLDTVTGPSHIAGLHR